MLNKYDLQQKYNFDNPAVVEVKQSANNESVVEKLKMQNLNRKSEKNWRLKNWDLHQIICKKTHRVWRLSRTRRLEGSSRPAVWFSRIYRGKEKHIE